MGPSGSHPPHRDRPPQRGLLWYVKRRVGWAASAIRWAVANPRRIHEHKRWILQGLGMGRRYSKVEALPGRLVYLAPTFLDEHGIGLDDPPFVRASEATHVRPDDVVLGLVVGDDARAYPWWALDDYHFSNDVVGGQPVLIMLCEMCSSGVAFDASIGGRRLMFDHGPHYQGTNTFVDRQTGSIWSAYLTRAIQGELTGTSISMLPLQQMTWAAWLELHPDSKVLAEGVGSRTGHGSEDTIGREHVPRGFQETVARWDGRLPFATLIMGAIAGDAQRAYPLDELGRTDGVVNDDLGGVPIAIFAFQRAGSYGALAHARTLDGRVLTFRAGEDGPVDVETGSSWTYEGIARSGPLAGERLEFVSSHVSEWFVWAANYPEMTIWRADASSFDGKVSGDGHARGAAGEGAMADGPDR